MAAELSEMKKKEGNKEADKLAQIVEHEKMARKIAAELVEAYASDRKCEFVGVCILSLTIRSIDHV